MLSQMCSSVAHTGSSRYTHSVATDVACGCRLLTCSLLQQQFTSSFRSPKKRVELYGHFPLNWGSGGLVGVIMVFGQTIYTVVALY